MNFQPEKPKNGILFDRCDRWTAKILEDFPLIQTDDVFSSGSPVTLQNSGTKYTLIRNMNARQMEFLKGITFLRWWRKGDKGYTIQTVCSGASILITNYKVAFLF